MDSERIWQAKLAAWIHDPAEKALVLLRDPSGHEGGTVAALKEKLFGSQGVPADLLRVIERADHWASAADRPQFPRSPDGQYASWAQVNFVEEPVLVHPLSGRPYQLLKLHEIDFESARAVSMDHFEKLIARTDAGVDYRRTFLSFWRCGPGPHRSLGALWEVLPADTRIPDHSIWDHLQLTSAFAGAMAGDPDGRVALMAVSLGPVQSFIEQSRSTSDLWAGSHLLSRLAWEALRRICDQLGPDSVIFPHLHGVPLVDMWLRRQGVEVKEPELDEASDANPAFIASLPNRFVAIVPEAAADTLVRSIESGLREWVTERAKALVQRLLESAGMPDRERAEARMLEQAARQLSGFPEVHWAVVPWRLAGAVEVAPDELRRVTRAVVDGIPAGALLGTEVWQLLSREIRLQGASFYRPNPGVLYPDLYLLLDRVVAAAKATRAFEPAFEVGYRCSICGEREWLTDDPDALTKPRNQRRETLWTRVASRNPSWSRKGEHLCALCALKRLWPRLFVDELAGAIRPSEGTVADLRRFVVSTHTMALAPTLERLIDSLFTNPSDERLIAYRRIAEEIEKRKIDEFVALPKRTADELTRRRSANEERASVIRRLPALLDRLAEEEDEEGQTQREVRGAIKIAAGVSPERYYALILLDGDRMGAWLSGSDPEGRVKHISFRESWHPKVGAGVDALAAKEALLAGYLGAVRPPSPARHLFISRALNGFAIHVARFVVEECYSGKLLYAGGDDVLAMVAIDDLLEVLLALRCAYSGVWPGEEAELRALLRDARSGAKIQIGNGHLLLDRDGRRRLLRMMGERATMSAGAVIAHYSAPLGKVLRELRAAERRAKENDRDSFSVTLMKRAGETLSFTSKWFPPPSPESAADVAGQVDPTGTAPHGGLRATSIGALVALRNALAKHLSRRAAYHVLEWLDGVGPDAPDDQVRALLEYQFRRQAKASAAEKETFEAGALAGQLVGVAAANARVIATKDPTRQRPTTVDFVRKAVALAEFLAREGRVEATSREAAARSDVGE